MAGRSYGAGDPMVEGDQLGGGPVDIHGLAAKVPGTH